MEALNQINEQLRAHGLTELAVVSPKDCLGQDKNARYFKPEIFQQLVENVKRDGRLESTPLVYVDGENYRIISGHHRVDAAKEAGLENILVMVTDPASQDEIISKQLSHNALVGIDDQTVLSELFQAIDDIQLKLATGLQDEIMKVSYQSLNFKVGTWKEFTILFLEEQEAEYDAGMEAIAKDLQLKGNQAVRLTNVAFYDRFSSALRKVKRIENIKSNGTALLRMVELAMDKLNEDGSK